MTPLDVAVPNNEFADLIPKKAPPAPSAPIEDPWLRPKPAAVDVTATRRPAPPGQPTIKAAPRVLDRSLPDFPTGEKNLETEPRIGDQGIPEMARDFVAGKGTFAPNKPAGVVADLTGAWPARAGYQSGKAMKEGHPGVAAAMAGMAALPVVGGEAAGVARRLLKDVPFEAYSRLESAVAKAPFETGTAEQWAAALKPNVAAGERQWRGVDQLLEQNAGKPITKAQIQQHLEANPIKIGQSSYGGKPPKVAIGTNGIPIDWRVDNALPHPGAIPAWYVYNPEGDIMGLARTEGEARELAITKSGALTPKSAKFSSYKEPGGENYTENVLTLKREAPKTLPPGYKVKEVPNTNDGFSHNGININDPTSDEQGFRAVDPEQYYGSNPNYQAWKARPRKPAYSVVSDDGRYVGDDYDTPEEAIAAAHSYGHLEGAPKDFSQPGHFPDKNPLAHNRFTDHTLPNGEKVRFIEEMQSDWHQRGRKYSYQGPERDALKRELDEINNKLNTDEAYQQGQSTTANLDERLRLSNRANEIRHATDNAVPDAPFKKTEDWTELNLKSIIDQAHKDGIDRIAWTTGDQQAARYDLSRHVDRITYDPENGNLTAWKNNQKVHEGNYDEKALPDVIGKEAAENLMSGDNQVGLEGDHPLQILEGEGLKVGGAGMRSYYDRMLPKVVEGYGKKMGAKLPIEPVNLFKPTGGQGFEGPLLSDTQLYAARRNALRDEGDDPESPIVMQIDDIIHRIEAGQDYRAATEQSLAQLTQDMGGDTEHANIVADYLSGKYRRPSEPTANQSFSLHPLRGKGPQPLWGVGAGAAAAVGLEGDPNKKKPGLAPDNEFGDLVPQQKADSSDNEFQDLIPKKSIWDRIKGVNEAVRKAIVPDALQQLETGASKFGKEQGEWGVGVAKALGVLIDPKKVDTPESQEAARTVLAAIATVALPAGLHKYAQDVLAGRTLGKAFAATKAPAPERPVWDRSAQPVDQPQPLTRPQEILRARLQTEGIQPAGAITRRPAPQTAPPVEPAPEAQTYSTKGAVRRPAPGTEPVAAPAEPALPPEGVERRVEPERQAWTPEQRSQYITESQKKYAANVNKPWSQWSPEEKQAYFADQAKVRDTAPWKVEIETARQLVGDEEFRRRAIEAASQVPIGDKLDAVKKTAHEIVTGPPAEAGPPAEPAPATWPPLPAEGDIRPVASANGEFDARPGIMRDVNRGEQPTDLPSPMRLPEPTPADRAVVQPKGYKEISPEEVAARKAAERPEPVATGTPADTSPAAAEVDDEGLFFEHRTPGGALRDVRRVSTDGLIKAHREMQDQIVRDQQSSIYRNVEADVSGTQYGQHIQVGDRTERGTTYQSEAAQRLRNYQKVMDRINGELERRGLSGADVHDRIQEQEQLEAAIEQEAMQHNNAEEDAGDAFGDFGEEPQKPAEKGPPAEKPATDVLNVAKLNLGSKTAEQRMAQKLEDFRTQRENNRQTFSEADVNRKGILDELRAGDPLALPTEKAKKLSGEELLARRDLVRENDRTITELSKHMESGTLPADAYAQASQLVERAVQHNDALLSDLVTGSSQKGRDLNLLRRLANDSTDPAVWRVQAKRMLGDRPLTAEIDAAIRKLASAAEDACR